MFHLENGLWTNPELPETVYGKWMDLIKAANHSNCPGNELDSRSHWTTPAAAPAAATTTSAPTQTPTPTPTTGQRTTSAMPSTSAGSLTQISPLINSQLQITGNQDPSHLWWLGQGQSHAIAPAPAQFTPPNLPTLPTRSAAEATADWLKQAKQGVNDITAVIATSLRTRTMSPRLETTSSMDQQPPTQADFHVPTNQIEHSLIVARLVSGGSLPAEAEQIITSHKTDFNKSLREFKKAQTQASTQANKRNTKNSKHVNSQLTNNGNKGCFT